MKCQDFDRMLHLYLDGELKEKEAKEVEEHLLTCQRCAEKLEELKTLEEKVKRIKLPEPSGFYWKTFTEQVRNKIILRRRKSLWAKFRSAWENFFYYSPAKLRIAAGIASVLLVFIIGKLYWDYHGTELQKIESQKIEKALSAPAPQKVEAPVPTIKDTIPVETQIKAGAPAESILSAPEEKVQKKEEVQVKIPLPESTITVTAEKPKIEKGVTANLRTVTQPESGIPPSKQETTVQTTTKRRAEDLKMATEYLPIVGFEFKPYYKVDETNIKFITEKDTSIEADTLKKIISSWKAYLEKNPESEFKLAGFSQLTTAYQLLFLKSKDDSLLQAGVELLSKYKESISDQKTKDELSKKISDLENLKKK